jgi:hypothetical protein
VIIEDMGGTGSKTDAGADIDAIQLSACGQTRFPLSVKCSQVGSGEPDSVLGEPDGKYTSLGGAGGHVMVDFGDNGVFSGDTISVTEVGDAAGVGESYSVGVGNTPDPYATDWVELGQGWGNKDFTVP